MRRRIARRVVVCACAVGALAVAPASASALGTYVALGDSFTAGPLILSPKGDPIDCGRSDHNYPTLVAAQIAPSGFRDVSCGSAQTRDMTAPQTGLPLGGTNPPQFDALDPDVELVTVGIGGNDMGFGPIVATCVSLGVQALGAGRPCTERYAPGGADTIARRIEEVVGPRLTAVLEAIQARSPRARLVVVGDPDPVPTGTGCFAVLPLAPGDLPYLHGLARRLHEMKAARAAAAGAEYVDLLSGSLGHDICRLPGTKWYEGIVPTAPAYPAHPNALGMRFAAEQVLDVLRRPVPNDFAVARVRGGRSGGIALRLVAPARGTFTIAATGRGLRYPAATVLAPRAGELATGVRLARAGRSALRRRGRARVALQITFAPVAGEPLTRRVLARVGARRARR